MAKKKLVIANWKMNPITADEAKTLFTYSKKAALRCKSTRVVICPPFPYLSLFSNKVTTQAALGAQDVFSQYQGAYTGEVSAPMLRDLRGSYCIVGHSERRALGETNEIVSEKIKALLNEGITPIVCIGESLRDEGGSYLSFLEAQLEAALRNVSRQKALRLILAYEPVWAIGKTARDTMSGHELHQTILFIRKLLTKYYGRKCAMSIPIVYGGSAEPDNVADLLSSSGITGFLVGHASLDPLTFSRLLQTVDIA